MFKSQTSTRLLVTVAVLAFSLVAANQARANLILWLSFSDDPTETTNPLTTSESLTLTATGTTRVYMYATIDAPAGAAGNGLDFVNFSVVSNQLSGGGAITAGGVTGPATLSPTFDVSGSHGTAQNLNPDGITDIGSNATVASTDYIKARRGTQGLKDSTGGFGTPADYTYYLGYIDIAAAELSVTGGVTEFSMRGPTFGTTFGASAQWYENTSLKKVTGSSTYDLVTAGAGVKFVVEGAGGNPAIGLSEPTPAEMKLLAGGVSEAGVSISNIGDPGSTLEYTLTAGGAGLAVVGGPFAGSLLTTDPPSYKDVLVSAGVYGDYVLTWTATASGLTPVLRTVDVTVGKAKAKVDSLGVGDFDAAEKLIAQGVGNLKDLASKVTNTADDPNLLGSEAKLLYGEAAPVLPEVSMNWRVRVGEELTSGVRGLASDVLMLGGIADGEVVYVLEMSYDENAPTIGGAAKEAQMALGGGIFLGSWDAGAGMWVNAIVLNDGGLKDLQHPMGAYPTDAGFVPELGMWGVDTDNNVVWAVLNHSSEFAVVPEPATMAFLALGGLAMAGAGVARRRRSRAAGK